MQELDLFYKSCEWPAKIAKVMKEASTKAATDHKCFEQTLKARRKDFGDSLGDLENRVAAFSQYDVIARRAEHATEVCSICSSAHNSADVPLGTKQDRLAWGKKGKLVHRVLYLRSVACASTLSSDSCNSTGTL